MTAEEARAINRASGLTREHFRELVKDAPPLTEDALALLKAAGFPFAVGERAA